MAYKGHHQKILLPCIDIIELYSGDRGRYFFPLQDFIKYSQVNCSKVRCLKQASSSGSELLVLSVVLGAATSMSSQSPLQM